jgi:CDGSH-type Zn-finger protein
MKLIDNRFTRTEKSCGTKGVTQVTWNEWTYNNYKIVQYTDNEYYAYYNSEKGSSHVCAPPHVVKCVRSCGDPYCDGWHRAWETLESAIDACLEHEADLPW